MPMPLPNHINIKETVTTSGIPTVPNINIKETAKDSHNFQNSLDAQTTSPKPTDPKGCPTSSVPASVGTVKNETELGGLLSSDTNNNRYGITEAKKREQLVNKTVDILRDTLLYKHSSDPNIMNFISLYLMCRDVRQAATAIGLKKRDGDNILRLPDVTEALAKIGEATRLKHGFEAGEVVERVKEIMQVDLIEFEADNGRYKRLRDMSPEMRRAIKSIKVKNVYAKDPNGMVDFVESEVISIELWDKMKAVELLGREKDIFKETRVTKHDVSENMSNLLLESRQRAESRLAQLAQPVNSDEIIVEDES